MQSPKYRIRKEPKNYSLRKIFGIANRLARFLQFRQGRGFSEQEKIMRFSSGHHINLLLGLYKNTSDPKAKALIAKRIRIILASWGAGSNLSGFSREEIKCLGKVGKKRRAGLSGKDSIFPRQSEFEECAEELDKEHWAIKQLSDIDRFEDAVMEAQSFANNPKDFERLARYWAALAGGFQPICKPEERSRLRDFWKLAKLAAQKSGHKPLEKEILERARNAGVNLQ